MLIRLLFLNVIFSLSAQSASGCFEYEPNEVSISGTLSVQYFPGPPNYEDFNAGDAKEGALIVATEKPFCVSGDPESEINDESYSNLTRLHLLILDDQLWPTIERLKGKKLRVTGTLFQAITGHHRTKVLMTVKSAEAL